MTNSICPSTLPVPATTPALASNNERIKTSFLDWLNNKYHSLDKGCGVEGLPPKLPSGMCHFVEQNMKLPEHQCTYYGELSWGEMMVQARMFHEEGNGGKPMSTLAVRALTILLFIPSAVLFFVDPPLVMSRNLALWLVYVPYAKCAGQGGILALILPSQKPRFKHELYEAQCRGERLVIQRLKILARLEELLRSAQKKELSELEKFEAIDATHDNSSTHYKEVVFNAKQFKKYDQLEGACKKMRSRVGELELEIKEIRKTAEAEQCLKMTGYNDIADWADDAWAAFRNLVISVSTVSALGIGLTYATIFSAARGDIGLMSWAFSLFIIALVIATTIQGLLVWCGTLARIPFSTPVVWELLLGVFVYGSLSSAVAAIVLLMVSVDTLSVAEVRDEGQVIFNGSPKPPTYVTFGALGVGIGATLTVFLLFCLANGIKKFIWRRSLDRLNAPKKLLEHFLDYDSPTFEHSQCHTNCD